MKRQIITILFCCTYISICVSPAKTGEIDLKTKEMLDTIIAGYRTNRAQIKDLAMTGTAQTTVSQGNDVKSYKKLNFEYFQLESKKRIDYTYTKESNIDDWAKTKVIRWAFTGKSSLSYLTESQLASVHDEAKFQMMSPLIILDTPFVTRAWKDFAGQIEHYLRRWDPSKDEIKVTNIDSEGRTLLEVIYSSTRGGRNVIEWKIDPLKGFERVSEKWESYRSDGSLFQKISATYSVVEITPDIWRGIGCDMHTESWLNGEPHFVTQTIKPISYLVNTGKIKDSLFTLEGLEVPSGMVVSDHTFDPPLEYILGAPPITESELEDIMSSTLTDTSHSKIEVEGQTEVDNQAGHDNLRAEETAIDTTASKPQEELGIIADQNRSMHHWLKVLLWIIAIFILSAVLGRLLFQKGKSS